MTSALRPSAAGVLGQIDGRQATHGCGYAQIVGVKPYEKQINVRNPANPTRSISRSKLAEKIAKEIFEFMKVGRCGPPGSLLVPVTRQVC